MAVSGRAVLESLADCAREENMSRHSVGRGLCSPVAALVLLVCLGAVTARAGGASSFVHWETPHVRPLALTPDGRLLLATNVADNRLEIYHVSHRTLILAASIVTGLDPVSVRARSATEAWVINHVSDSVSIVDLEQRRVLRTLNVGDEPTDVVFAGTPERAFIAMSQLNEVWVHDPADLSAPPTVVPIAGEDPRALATDGQRVYAAVFESGNRTTILSEFEVSGGGPYGGVNPPPNDGASFSPPIAIDLPTPPPVGMIVRKDGLGRWLDDNNGDWSGLVTWDLHDHDLAIIDAGTLAVSYARGLMNLNMAVAVRPDGQVTVVGTDGINEVRFEPNLRGGFVRVLMATVDPESPDAPAIVDLNPHLDYSTHTVPLETRRQSVGDPRGVAWNAVGDVGYVTGMGSSNVMVIDSAGQRLGRIDVGAGPTGVVVDDARAQVYVLNKFDGSISIIDANARTEVAQVPFFDPTPTVVKAGRPHLYDTHATSGLGQASCASCHPDARMDQIAWDLGNPSGAIQDFNQICLTFPVFGSCEDWHPMKGPLVTQTLIGSDSSSPLHWRGDRGELADFNPTFVDLHGADSELTDAEMDAFADFIATIKFPPNPNRNLDGSLKTTPLSNGGTPRIGGEHFDACAGCHFPGQGFNFGIAASAFRGDSQSFNVSHLRNMYEKTGFDMTRTDNNRGFGFLHDGHADTMFRLMLHPVFGPDGGSPTFTDDPAGLQARRDVEALMLSDVEPLNEASTIPVIGRQETLVTGPPIDPQERAAVRSLIDIIDAQQLDNAEIVVAGVVEGVSRGYRYQGTGMFQSDRATEVLTLEQLVAVGGPGNRLTFTAVPTPNADRVGLDRDQDGAFDRDELDVCSDPADASSTPANPGGGGDADGDADVDISDFGAFAFCQAGPGLPNAEICGCRFDDDDDTDGDLQDFAAFQTRFSGAK